MNGGAARRLDESQAAARDVERNAVITAGAGSGKTTVLAERFSRLLIDKGLRAGEILTLTFTRKAAAEMYSRIHAELSRHTDNPHVRAELAVFQDAPISTIDGFCAEIVRGCAARYGIPPTFSQDEQALSRMCEQAALDFVIDRRDDPAFSGLLAQHGFDAADDLAKLGRQQLSIAGDADCSRHLQIQVDLARTALEGLVGRGESIRAAVAVLEPGVNKAMLAAREACRQQADLRELLAAGPPWTALEAACQLIGKLGKPGSTKLPEAQLYRELVDQARQEQLAERGPALISFLNREPMTRRLLELCGEYHEIINQAKRSTGVLSFQDVMDLAVQALIDDPSLRLHYKRRFRHIMIDEFQDNNERQKNLLFLLAERADLNAPGIPRAADLEAGKLFFVGDEKQSIYQFRGADVSVFKKLARQLDPAGQSRIELAFNYRSTRRLVDFHNRLFSRVMGSAKQDFEAEYREARVPPGAGGDDSRIVLAWKPRSGPDSAAQEDEVEDGAAVHSDEAEALYIGRLIREWVDAAVPVRQGASTRPLRYDDVAVLMRSLSNQYRFERVFQALGIPHTVQQTRSLFLEAPAADFYAILQLALYPDDRAAYAALLRSPFVNLSDPGLAAVLLRGEPAFQAVGLEGEDAERYRRGGELLASLRRELGSTGVAELLGRLWYEEGYRYSVLCDPRLHAYMEMYDYLVELARSERGASLCAFLDFLRDNLGEYEKVDELEPAREDQQGVRLLSIHKSKGLEFGVVILANAGNSGRADSGSRPIGFHPACGPCFAHEKRNIMLELLKEKERDIAELRRLLYVACTRARDHLVISGCLNSKNSSRDWETKSLLGMVLYSLDLSPDSTPEDARQAAAAAGLDGVMFQAIPKAAAGQPRAHGGRPRREIGQVLSVYQRLPAVERSGRRIEYTATELEALWQAGRPAAVRESLPALPFDGQLADEDEAWFGELCHAVIAVRAVKGWFEAATDELPALLPEALARRLPAGLEFPRLLAEAARLADGFFDSKLGRLVAAAGRVEAEVPFLLRWPIAAGRRLVVRGVIDLAAVSRDCVRIVDFKTNRELAAGGYLLQLELYRRAAGALYGLPARTSLFYLRAGREVEAEALGRAADEWAARTLSEKGD